MADSTNHEPVLSSAFAWLLCGAEDLGLSVWSPIAQLLPHRCLTWRLWLRLCCSKPTSLDVQNGDWWISRIQDVENNHFFGRSTSTFRKIFSGRYGGTRTYAYRLERQMLSCGVLEGPGLPRLSRHRRLQPAEIISDHVVKPRWVGLGDRRTQPRVPHCVHHQTSLPCCRVRRSRADRPAARL